MKTMILAAMTMVVLVGAPSLGLADDAAVPLAPLDRLVGGRWRLGESVQEYTWDMDRQQLNGRAWTTSAEGERLVSVGSWYYHPGKRSIVGSFVARDMGIALFEYATRFDGDVMVNEVVAWTVAGEASTYEEHWRFTGPDSYVWELYEAADEGPKKIMEGVFRRVD